MPNSFDELGPLAPYMRFAERSSRKLARSTFYGMTRWQAKLEYRQTFLGRLVDIGAELFAMAATAAYADTLGRERPERRAEAQELAELFCIQAKRRVETLFGRALGQRRRRQPGRRPRACWTDAIGGSRRASSTRRARAR